MVSVPVVLLLYPGEGVASQTANTQTKKLKKILFLYSPENKAEWPQENRKFFW